MRVLVFGDSIAQGFWDTEGGWVEGLRKYYVSEALKDLRTKRDYPVVFNLGIDGDASTNLLKRVKNETEARFWPGQKYIAMIAIGTNDDVLSEHSLINENLEKIIEILDPMVDDIILIGNTACDESLTRPVFWADIHYKNEDLQKTENIIAEIAKANDKKFIPVFEQFKRALDEGDNLLADGLHPNNEGHEFIFKIVRPELDKLLNI